MIVIDGSALLAILKGEKEGERCLSALRDADRIVVSAASLTEMLIVAARKEILPQMQALLRGLAPIVEPLTETRARAAADAYRRWGKGFHKAELNLGDSFAYALAEELACPLLFVGNDFALTDMRSALK